MLQQKLLRYFTKGVSHEPSWRVGMEVETLFTDKANRPLGGTALQAFYRQMLASGRWERDDSLTLDGSEVIESIRDSGGNIIGT